MCPCNFGQWWLFDTIAVTNKGDGKFSFTMPDSKVDVKVTFVKSEVKPDQPSKTAFVDVPENSWYADAADFVAQRGLMSGVGENLFGGNQNTTRAMLMTILARMDGQDVTGGATWFENAQNWAKEKGISDGTNPNGTINRAQMVTMLWRTMGQPAAAGGVSFVDVPANSYYAQAVAWAIENGITNGMTETTFAPNATCTRGQSVTFLHRALKGTASGSANFTDVKSDAFYADAINWAVANNVTNGTSNTTFSPNADCTRAEIVTFLYRAYQGK